MELSGSLGLELPVRLPVGPSQTCYTRTGAQSVPVKICREISGPTFRAGVNGPGCAQTTGAKVKEERKKKKEVEMFLFPTKPQRPELCLPGSCLTEPEARGQVQPV